MGVADAVAIVPREFVVEEPLVCAGEAGCHDESEDAEGRTSMSHTRDDTSALRAGQVGREERWPSRCHFRNARWLTGCIAQCGKPRPMMTT